MDFTMAAVKVTCALLKETEETEITEKKKKRCLIGGLMFQRAWVQGLIVWTSQSGDSLLLDDSTDLLLVSLNKNLSIQQHWTTGTYVMVVGSYHVPESTGEQPMLKVHKMVDLSEYPDREAMWYLEVIEAYKLFYEQLI